MKKCPFCAEEIQDEAIICRFCQRDLKTGSIQGQGQYTAAPEVRTSETETNFMARVLFLLIAGGVLIFIVWNSQVDSRPSSESARFVMPEPLLSSEPAVVTKTEYDQIRDGMSYAEVVSIIGAPGEEQSRSDLAGFTTVMYSWMNQNGSNMNAMFQNRKLVTKAQFGLP